MMIRSNRYRMLVLFILFITGSLAGFSCDANRNMAITTPDQTKLSNANRALRTAQYTRPPDTPTQTSTPVVLASVTGASVYLRTGPGMNYEPAGGVIQGQLLVVTGQNIDGTWLQVYKEGVFWIKTQYVRLNFNLQDSVIPVIGGSMTPAPFTDLPGGASGPGETGASSATPTITNTPPEPPPPTPTNTQTQIPSSTPTPTRLPTSTPIPTRVPDAGVTDWLVYESMKVGVRALAWDKIIGSHTPGDGRIFVSLYIVAVNVGQDNIVFNPLDFRLVDGGGEIHRSTSQTKDPAFSVCTVKPAGICEGWWTTSIRDLANIRQNLLFNWNLNIGLKSLEVPIIY
ncbi:MAG: hypothetical protein ACM3PY_09805 [Omnitrophica WOR_2 bacterium]